MAYLNDRVLDNGLGVFNDESTRLDICDTEPSTYAGATTTYTLGNKTWTTGAGSKCADPSAKSGGGREVVVAAITDGTVTGTDTAAYWAISDTANERLLAAGALSAPQGVTSGNTFTLASFTIGIPGPA